MQPLHPLWAFVLTLLAVMIAALYCPVRLNAEARLTLPQGAVVKLELRFFYGLFHLHYRLEANLLQRPYLTVQLFQGKEAPRVLWRIGEKKERTRRMQLPLANIWRHVHLLRLNVSGELGIRDDAFWTVMLCGVLSALLQSVFVYACAEKGQSALCVRVSPEFAADCLRLNLEGIAECAPIHIIIAIMIWNLNNRKGQKAIWRILSKTS